MLHLPLEQVLGEPLARLVVPEDRVKLDALVQQGLAGPSKGELSLYSKNKSTMPVEISLRQVVLDGVTRLGAIVSDITERRQAEEHERQLNAELEQRVQERTAQLEAANLELQNEIAERRRMEKQSTWLASFPQLNPNPIIEVDLEGIVHFVNPAAEKALPDIKQRTMDHPWLVEFESLASTFGDNRMHVSAREVLVGKTWYLQMMYNVPETGRVRIYGIDITERKQAEQHIAKLNRDLEQRATQLEIANRELESFAYSVSHDLRTPLAGISGFASLLLEDYGELLPPEARRYGELIRNNSAEMNQLVEGLLTFSRSTRQPLMKQRVEIAPLTRQVLKDLANEQSGRQVEIVLGELPPTQADPVLLKQVLTNLLSNALKFTRGREVARIEINSMKSEEGETTYFVRDNGVGFDNEQAERLFGVFQRLHHAQEFEGTGVGLAIVERIIHRHGGRVSAEGQVDQGATFYFTL
jgi:signal transduction histidine kinase